MYIPKNMDFARKHIEEKTLEIKVEIVVSNSYKYS